MSIINYKDGGIRSDAKFKAFEKSALVSLSINGCLGSHMGGLKKRVDWFDKMKKNGLVGEKMQLTAEGQTMAACWHLEHIGVDSLESSISLQN